jgi:hypothetical protein
MKCSGNVFSGSVFHEQEKRGNERAGKRKMPENKPARTKQVLL